MTVIDELRQALDAVDPAAVQIGALALVGDGQEVIHGAAQHAALDETARVIAGRTASMLLDALCPHGWTAGSIGATIADALAPILPEEGVALVCVLTPKGIATRIAATVQLTPPQLKILTAFLDAGVRVLHEDVMPELARCATSPSKEDLQ